MASRSTDLSKRLNEYVIKFGSHETAIQAELRAETARLPMAMMQIGAEQGAFMQMLVRLIGARRCIEVGVFTGFSALAVALALPADGRILACDVNEEWTALAKRYWAKAGVQNKIELKLQPALKTLDAEIAAGRAGAYDFAFIDADKTNYDSYYERALTLLRKGGLIAIDNVLWHGKVVDASANDAETKAIRALNEKVHGDARVHMCLTPIGDGLTLAQKR
ncbi:MAG TPA: class I SAM-dependent methyltransferase [Candidatus Cybelea sp.]|nr:class I SAM-dependent methyltransferase [Candidatus Cybelea sp.]